MKSDYEKKRKRNNKSMELKEKIDKKNKEREN